MSETCILAIDLAKNSFQVFKFSSFQVFKFAGWGSMGALSSTWQYRGGGWRVCCLISRWVSSRLRSTPRHITEAGCHGAWA